MNSFVHSDPCKWNDSPFTAFNNSPVKFVDLNGQAPLSAAEILEIKFGDERHAIYEQLDQNLNAGTFGRINEGMARGYYNASKTVEASIAKNISKTMERRDEMITEGAQNELTRAYMSGRRSRFIETQDLASKLPSEDGTYMRRFRDPITAPGSLRSLAANAYLEGTHEGKELFGKELEEWENVPQNVYYERIYERTQMYMERGNTSLTAEEMAELYGARDYMHANLFRAVMNARDMSGFRMDASHPYGFDTGLGTQSEPFNTEVYQQFRQQNITLFGDDGRSELTVPFRRYTFFE